MDILILDNGGSCSADLLAVLQAIPEADCLVFDDPEPMLARCVEHPPALALIGGSVPDSRVMEFLEACADLPELTDTPLIWAMAHRDEACLKQAIDRGIWDFLTWPIDPAAWQTRITGMIALARSRRELADRFRQPGLDSPLVNTFARATLHSLSEGIITTDCDSRIEYLNPVAEQMTGWSCKAACGQPVQDIMKLLDEKTSEPIDLPIMECLRTHGLARREEALLMGASGRAIPIEERATPIHDSSGTVIGAVSVFSDISRRKRTEHHRAYLANFDALTGLPDRILFQDRLEGAIRHARRVQRHLALLCLDIDRFKTINDCLGHPVGDRLLQQIADRLRAELRDEDTIARLGGDEFGIILNDLADHQQTARVVQKIIDAFVSPFQLNGQEFHLTVSVGIAMGPRDAFDHDTLLKNADTAMYRAKELGGNNHQFYTSAMKYNVTDRFYLESGLRHALERQEFSVFYQPKLDLQTGRVIGAEALLRWQRGDGSMIPPVRFIPLLEESGLIVPIGEWVLRSVVHQIRVWRDAGFPSLLVSVNLSARQFRDHDFAATVFSALHDEAVNAEQLELEITESLLMETTEESEKILHNLKSMGVTLSIDDFGTGYSSLSYLKRFPVDILKIDRSFVREVPIDRQNSAIAEAIIALARTLSLKVTAEGVETREQLEFLCAIGCDHIQGYYLGRPMSAGRFTEWMQRYVPQAS